MKNKYVAAIDVGTTKIVTLLGKRNENNKLELIGFSRLDSKGIRRGEVLNPEQAAVVVSNSVADLQKRTGLKISDVFVGVVGQHIRIIKSRTNIIRDHNEDDITAEEVDRLKKDAAKIALKQGEEILHVLPQGYFVDGEVADIVSDPVGMIGKKLDGNFSMVVGNVDSLKRIRKCIQKAGLNIKEIILEPLASSESVLYDVEKETGVALVDIGGGTSDVAIFYDNVLRHSAVIPCGGNIVTSDIKTACGLSEQVAEDVKVQFGMALSDKADENKVVVIPPSVPGHQPKEISFSTLANIIQARMEEIIDAVKFHIENSGFSDKLGSGIVITGGGAMLKHLVQLFQFSTGKPIRIGYPGAHLAGDSESINEPNYATGVGLLMKGLEYMDEHGWDTPTVTQNVEIDEKMTEEPVPIGEKAEKGKKIRERKEIKIKTPREIPNLFEMVKRYFDDDEAVKNKMNTKDENEDEDEAIKKKMNTTIEVK
ncbi:MAG: cell division protein FtsA [Bacteroidales bacterium]|jgi:cell division protein FtsA|nr:cell division protein FtsA [Bacteroidales bacterium]